MNAIPGTLIALAGLLVLPLGVGTEIYFRTRRKRQASRYTTIQTPYQGIAGIIRDRKRH